MSSYETRQTVLGEMLQKHGEVKASRLVREAKAKRHPMHDDFNWDDASAAHEHRLSQARRIIRVTKVRIETGEEKRLIHVPSVSYDEPTAADTEREGSYKPIQVVVQCETSYEAALRELMTLMRSVEKSIRELKAAHGEETDLMPTLQDAMSLAKKTLKAMIDERVAA